MRYFRSSSIVVGSCRSEILQSNKPTQLLKVSTNRFPTPGAQEARPSDRQITAGAANLLTLLRLSRFPAARQRLATGGLIAEATRWWCAARCILPAEAGSGIAKATAMAGITVAGRLGTTTGGNRNPSDPKLMNGMLRSAWEATHMHCVLLQLQANYHGLRITSCQSQS